MDLEGCGEARGKPSAPEALPLAHNVLEPAYLLPLTFSWDESASWSLALWTLCLMLLRRIRGLGKLI